MLVVRAGELPEPAGEELHSGIRGEKMVRRKTAAASRWKRAMVVDQTPAVAMNPDLGATIANRAVALHRVTEVLTRPQLTPLASAAGVIGEASMSERASKFEAVVVVKGLIPRLHVLRRGLGLCSAAL